MSCSKCHLISLASIALSALYGAAASASDCASLAALKLPYTTITMARSMPAGTLTPAPKYLKKFSKQVAVPVPFCRVTGRIAPTSDSDIQFEVWLPESGWTGRYISVGNGGFAGSIRYDEMIRPLKGGSVVASTDDGHSGPAVGPTSASWALGHPERVIDYGYRAVHLTAVEAKAITTAYYGAPPKHSYFVGCSKGGQEGFMEVQRYPDDFDGIVSGAAANQWTNLFSSFSWGAQINLSSRASYISVEDLKKISSAVAAACDSADGVKDGLISDPLRCRVAESTIPLPAAKLHTYEVIHAGPVTSSGKRIYAGQAYGSEDVQWDETITGPTFEAAQTDAQEAMYGNGFFGNFVYQNPKWTFHDFNINTTPLEAERAVGKIINADGVDLTKFEAHHGKIIEFNGWSDSIVPPLGAISYYRKVVAAEGAGGAGGAEGAARGSDTLDARALEKTQQFYRLFLAPGVGHCGGGPGPNEFGQRGGDGNARDDMVVALERWVEQGIPPTKIIATKFRDNDPSKGKVMTRPLCAFPAVAKYRGHGNPDDAANFICKVE